MDRLATIANFPKDPKMCLDIYYNNKSEENNKYSQQFLELLLECWKRWDIYFSSDNKKIKKKADKLRKKFKPQENFYQMFMNKNERIIQNNPNQRNKSIPPR